MINILPPPREDASDKQWQQWHEHLWRYVKGQVQLVSAATTVGVGTTYVGVTTLSAGYTITLPSASLMQDGDEIVFQDETGSANTTTKVITIARAGTDTINGGTSVTITSAYGQLKIIKRGAGTFFTDTTSSIFITPEGGIAIRLTNSTGGASVKGYLVQPDTSVNNAFQLCTIGDPDIIGIVYEDGVADGSLCWVVIAGIADVYFVGNTTRGHLARMTATGDTGAADGKAISEAKPSSPFATDKHFQEIGHVIAARTGAGLAKCVIHFN